MSLELPESLVLLALLELLELLELLLVLMVLIVLRKRHSHNPIQLQPVLRIRNRFRGQVVVVSYDP